MKKFFKLISVIVIMMFINIIVVKSQVSTGFNFGNATDYVGWNSGQAFDINIRHDGAYNIDFWTNGNRQMTLTPTGWLGIGTTTPVHLLDINGGDLNLQGTYGYMLGGNYVLYNNGINSNIYVGLNAGNSTSSATYNTFVGNYAGNRITTGISNTFVGHYAGYFDYDTYVLEERRSS